MTGCEIETNWTHFCVLDLTTLGKELESDLYSGMGESSFSSEEKSRILIRLTKMEVN